MSDELVKRINDACVGHPHAKIPWPHYLLHECRDRIEAQAREIEELTALYKEQAKRHADNLAAQQGHIDLFSKRAEAAEARVAALTEALKRIANTFDDSWREGSLERMLGDTARHALTENTDAR